ncbi:hypothetical protein MTER_29470 [Mycolicibacter terrae]|uniref:DUF732 domain-containing protein n=1 Tax=Mycolicibacter terrae TaxID=1788 RepID=A0AAD1I4F5_9MYCO|nr:DUF732 domain-containing protein [Mycolicibacter terrae]ORW88482.1 hypothetical protein AWC28_04500 [Mycolicibacter terrae]BBX23536.1 hypothetical protein MTER_29470 [Mycolicibacter terrae]SNV62689.1 Conserved exported protein of uncharacterised function [Mycolicibacter terrae]
MRSLAAPLGALVMMIGLGGPAQAEPSDVDTDFLAALQAAGITYNRGDQAIVTAKMVCKFIAEGKPSPEVLEGLKERNPGLTTEHGTIFVGISARSYCPDQLVQNAAGGTP